MTFAQEQQAKDDGAKGRLRPQWSTVMPAVIADISQFSWAVREQLQTNKID